MDNIINDTSNLHVEAIPVSTNIASDESIASKMAAMRSRNQVVDQNDSDKTGKLTIPVAPSDKETIDITPEIDAVDNEDYDHPAEESDAPDEVSNDSTPATPDIIDFLEFAESNPDAKFKFMRNGKEVVVDAKKAASILGQGAAISEDARQLKVDRAEFDEYLGNKKSETEGLMLALEFTVKPALQKVYDQVSTVQGYQRQFADMLAKATTYAEKTSIEDSMRQNEKVLTESYHEINTLKPKVDQFYDIRKKQVTEVLNNNRKSFTDKDLKNEFIYGEIKDKVAKGWDGAKGQLVPGIDNIDLISADEHIISLLRDGLKYRDKPSSKSSGGSLAAMGTRNTGNNIPSGKQGDNLSNLREKAKTGDKKAGDNLLEARLKTIKASRIR